MGPFDRFEDEEDEDDYDDGDDYETNPEYFDVATTNSVQGVLDVANAATSKKSAPKAKKAKDGKTPKAVIITLPRKKVMRIVNSLSDEDQELIFNKEDKLTSKVKTISFKLDEISPDFAMQISRWKDLNETTRKAIASLAPEVDPATFEKQVVHSPREFAQFFTAYVRKVGEGTATLESKINGRWYPFFAQVQFYQGF